ncbi:hypothetical protein [Oceanicola sp. 502str15]|uniref:hypothetical protein n=1 Tax=Oceanicola sp. 502str15 TaxID=2696061 RepID=UPI0020946CDB|nr:hypothetical protein [Oceanicola sp. 502str15]MCO6384158.1 hypothetical protein [Oceanicola sp. 502str15]
MSCDLIWNEYQLLFGAYADFDGHALTLKGWSVTVGLAAMLSAYSQPILKNGRIALLLAAFSTVPFYIVDGLWKTYQRAYLPRLRELERLSAECGEGFAIIGDWAGTIGEKVLPVFLFPNVLLPHAFILAAGCLLAWKFPPGPGKLEVRA